MTRSTGRFCLILTGYNEDMNKFKRWAAVVATRKNGLRFFGILALSAFVFVVWIKQSEFACQDTCGPSLDSRFSVEGCECRTHGPWEQPKATP